MRRAFALILGLYILFLTLVPCVEKETNCPEATHIHLASPASDQHSNQNDSCSPFCHCACCSLPMEVTNSEIIAMISSSPNILAYSFSLQFHSFFVFSIWDPPKFMV
jgi:hypothetical protein